MRQLLPTVGDVDPVVAYLDVARPAPSDRPWVTVGMITTVDGGTAVGGRSGPLGGPADKAVFRAVRSVADVILVGAGTVRAEAYGPIRLPAEARAARLAAGRSGAAPRLAIVTTSLQLDLRSTLFTSPGLRPLVFTTSDADSDRRAAVADVAELRVAGKGRVDLAEVLDQLRSDGVDVVVCEGGPTLNAALVGADLVDEWCLSIAPLVVGGASPRIVHRAAPVPAAPLALASLLEGDGLLFGRWVRDRPGGT